LIRNGPPTQRFLLIGGVLVADNVGRVIQNMINDPNYVLAHVTSWRAIWRGADAVDVRLDPGTENRLNSVTTSGSEPVINSSSLGGNGAAVNSSGINESSGLAEPSKNIIGGDINLGDISESIINKIAEYLDYIFQPVQLNFSNEVMSNQIHNLSILLWILTICLSIFFISLLINITLFIFSESLLKYFKNRYLLWYISFNKKVFAFEMIMLSGWILYLLYILLIGLHYIAIHPIIFPV
jgi:hypothetical protein